MPINAPEIAVIGGGTGSFTLLRELKEFTPNITAIVNMSDDGSSTGVLRDELGVLPPGDIRQCLTALSDTPEVRDLLSYRFAEGSFKGHSLGNIILSGLELKYGSFTQALQVAASILNITGQVLPVTVDKHTLVMHDGDTIIRGEHNIDIAPIHTKTPRLELDPPARVTPEVEAALVKADLVVIAPGNLYVSLLPIFTVDGVTDAVRNSKAKKVVVSNLVTKPGQTDGWHVVDYVKRFEQHLGPGGIDVVLYNDQPPPPELLHRYAAKDEFPVDTAADRFAEIEAEAIGANFVADTMATQDSSDTVIRRTLIRHNAFEVGRQLMSLFYR